MKEVFTRAGSFVTRDEIADIVLSYGVALSDHRRVDAVRFPFVTATGEARQVQLTIGWLNEIVAVTASDTPDALGDGLGDDGLVAAIRHRIVALDPRGDVPLDDPWEFPAFGVY